MKMNFTFLTAAGTVAFFRSDAEQAEWTQHEMNLLCTFPFMPEKIIERGMTVLFQDPATDAWQAYYIRNCQTFPGDSYQQLSAEDLAITELSTWHIAEDAQLSGVAANAALGQILTGTGWSVGSNGASGTSSGDVYRGSVWENVRMIQSNWNVHIIPRVTVDASGITGRYLDIIPGEGVFRGVRLAIDKNITDSCVTYDDSEIYTALYGYGGSYSEGEGQNRVTKEYDFSGVTWNQTSVHPAKPLGQKYLEYPEMTAQYGINGRPRFGYYQNSDIKNAEILLQKTWESLKICCKPKISINGTVTELMRFGYTDQPLRLYDMAIVDILPAGDPLYKQITQLTVNLLDATGNHVVVGDYIPNIIYINRETEEYATGGGRGRGGGTRNTKEWSEFETHILASDRNIELNAVQIDEQGEILNKAGLSIDPITGVLIYADSDDKNIGAKFNVVATGISSLVEKTGVDSLGNNETLYSKYSQTAEEVTTLVNKTGVNSLGQSETLYSKQTQTAGEVSTLVTKTGVNSLGQDETLYSKLSVQADQIGLVVENVNGTDVVKRAAIIASINEDSTSTVTISADKVNLGAYVLASTLDTNWIKTQIENAGLISVGTLQVANGTTPTGSANMVNILSLTRKYRVVEVTDGNNNVTGYKLQYTNLLSGATWVDCESADQSVNFSRATTLAGTWSGSIYTITASPQGNAKSIGFSGDPGTNHVRLNLVLDSGTPTSSTTNEKYIDVPVKVTQSNPNAASTDRFTTTLQNVNATAAWNKGDAAGQLTGWNDAYGKMSWPGSNTSSATMTVKGPAATKATNPNQVSRDYTLSSDGDVAYIKQGATVVAQLTHNKWSSGFAAGVPTAATLGSKVTGTTWNVSIARGSYAAVGKTIDLANAYTDARTGYYTATQYNAAVANGHNDVIGTDIILSKTDGTDGESSSTVPDSSINKSKGKFWGKIWLKKADGSTYKCLRTFELSMPDSGTWTWSFPTATTVTAQIVVAGKTYSSTHAI